MAYIPRITGIAGLVERAAASPAQVSPEILQTVANTGVFRNASDLGFQEGYYPLPGEMARLLRRSGFEVKDEVSLKSIAHGLEKEVAQLDGSMKTEIDRLMAGMSRQPEIIATSGHVLVISCKKA